MLRSAGGVVAFLVVTGLPTALARAEDAAPGSTQVELAAAEGSGSGSFGCGQQTRVRYVRAAVEVRHSDRTVIDPRGQGITVLAGAAVEGVRATPVEQPTEENEGRPLGESWAEGRFGAHMRFGYRHRYFAVEGGGGFVLSPAREAAGMAFPELEGSIGRRDLMYLFGGFGAAQLTSQLSFAYPYLGLGCVPTPGLELEGRWGIQHGGFASADRLDVVWRLRMSRHWAFRGGLAIGELGGDASFAREASLGLQFTP